MRIRKDQGKYTKETANCANYANYKKTYKTPQWLLRQSAYEHACA